MMITLIQTAVVGVTALSVFKPLLSGIARALLLMVTGPVSKEEKAARAALRDAQMMQKMINASNCPSHAAELRAMAART